MNKALFQIIKTADGSPSLEWATTGEAMHNRMGAFAESVALYGEAIENAVKTFKGPKKSSTIGQSEPSNVNSNPLSEN